MVGAVAAGLRPLEFWDLTLRELGWILEAAERRREWELDLVIAGAWHRTRFDNLKVLKPLQHYVGQGRSGKRQPPSPEDLERKIDLFFQARMRG